jgi:hypothetical protein
MVATASMILNSKLAKWFLALGLVGVVGGQWGRAGASQNGKRLAKRLASTILR